MKLLYRKEVTLLMGSVSPPAVRPAPTPGKRSRRPSCKLCMRHGARNPREHVQSAQTRERLHGAPRAAWPCPLQHPFRDPWEEGKRASAGARAPASPQPRTASPTEAVELPTPVSRGGGAPTRRPGLDHGLEACVANSVTVGWHDLSPPKGQRHGHCPGETSCCRRLLTSFSETSRRCLCLRSGCRL